MKGRAEVIVIKHNLPPLVANYFGKAIKHNGYVKHVN